VFLLKQVFCTSKAFAGAASLRNESQYSSISTVTRLQAGWVGLTSQQGQEIFPSVFHNASWGHLAFILMDTRGVKEPGHEGNNSPPSNIKANSLWSSTSTPQLRVMLNEAQGNFLFAIKCLISGIRFFCVVINYMKLKGRL
jgi:hypothetical protein